MRIKSLLIFLSGVILLIKGEDKICFVYEIVRHGARAPISEDFNNQFHVKGSMLTQSGMRERYFLGRYNKQRYIDRAGLLNDVYNPF
jgi:hypothetical protein